MPQWDFECTVCGRIAEMSYTSWQSMQSAPPECCRKIMKLLPSSPNFDVKGFNAANGYSKGK